jgi:hypothetical protein
MSSQAWVLKLSDFRDFVTEVVFNDNGTARTLAWNAIYRAVGITLPATTVISKTLYLGMIYNSADSKWDVVAVSQEA